MRESIILTWIFFSIVRYTYNFPVSGNMLTDISWLAKYSILPLPETFTINSSLAYTAALLDPINFTSALGVNKLLATIFPEPTNLIITSFAVPLKVPLPEPIILIVKIISLIPLTVMALLPIIPTLKIGCSYSD